LTVSLAELVSEARTRIQAGYYNVPGEVRERRSMRAALSGSGLAVIAEVKMASPVSGRLSSRSPRDLIADYESGGAAALSVLTEPAHFSGSLENLQIAARSDLPVLMKDFIIDRIQMEAAANCGAAAVLLITEALSPDETSVLIGSAHALGLEVVLESCSLQGMLSAMKTKADIIALNQRDLRTMRVDPSACSEILPKLSRDGRPLLVMSGITDRADSLRARTSGADAILVGGALATADDPVRILRELRSVA
jgi:indole-3-glycerol phosphate synthase